MYMTDDERELVFRFIFLPLVRKVFERDLKIIRQAGFKFPDLYSEYINKKLIEVSQEIGTIKQAMVKTQLKVYEEERDDKGVTYLAVCRGYEERINFASHVIRSYVSEFMREYIMSLR